MKSCKTCEWLSQDDVGRWLCVRPDGTGNYKASPDVGGCDQYKPKSKQVKASDCKCCECGAQAVAFWPCIDPDTPSHPYCRKCLDKAKARLMAEIFKNKKK